MLLKLVYDIFYHNLDDKFTFIVRLVGLTNCLVSQADFLGSQEKRAELSLDLFPDFHLYIQRPFFLHTI